AAHLHLAPLVLVLCCCCGGARKLDIFENEIVPNRPEAMGGTASAAAGARPATRCAQCGTADQDSICGRCPSVGAAPRRSPRRAEHTSRCFRNGGSGGSRRPAESDAS